MPPQVRAYPLLRASIFAVALALCGCASTNVVKLAPIDQRDKSITVPPGGRGLAGKLKQALSKDGWRLSVFTGPTVTTGNISGGNVSMRTYDTARTRYSMSVTENVYDWRVIDFDPMYYHDVSVVDNRSGQEVLTVSGQHAGKVITQRFIQAMRY